MKGFNCEVCNKMELFSLKLHLLVEAFQILNCLFQKNLYCCFDHLDASCVSVHGKNKLHPPLPSINILRTRKNSITAKTKRLEHFDKTKNLLGFFLFIHLSTRDK